MIRSEQRGKETLGLLISEFESPKRSRRLAFINNRQRQMQRGGPLPATLPRPVPWLPRLSRGVFPGLWHSVAWLWGRICRGNKNQHALVPLPHWSLSWPCHHAPPQRCICSVSALPARPGTKPRALIKMRGLVHLASTLLARCCLLCDTFLSIIFHPAHCHGIRVSPGQHGEASVQGRAGQSLQRHKDALKIEVCCWCRW